MVANAYHVFSHVILVVPIYKHVTHVSVDTIYQLVNAQEHVHLVVDPLVVFVLVQVVFS